MTFLVLWPEKLKSPTQLLLWILSLVTWCTSAPLIGGFGHLLSTTTLLVVSALVVHRPFYISICISTLPTQHTTFTLLVVVCFFNIKHEFCTNFKVYLKGLCHYLRGYSVITHLALKIRSSVKKTPLNQACKYRVLVAFQLLLVSHLDWR